MDLLERRFQFDELDGAHRRARGGDGCVVLVAGEAGIGKTALVDSFTGRLSRGSPRVPLLWGACDALFTPRPLGPLLDMLPACGASLRSKVETGAPRERIFAMFLDELRGHEPPPVVVFEDVHWADEATLDLLKYVGRRIRQTLGMVVVTYRDDEVGPAHPLRRVLGELPQDAVRRIALPLLSEDAVTQLARRAGRSGAGLHALTGGNPFFVTEVLAGEDAKVPASVQDAVLARAAQLPPEARRVLDRISVVPGRVEQWLLEAVLGNGAGERIAQCAAAGVLVATAGAVAFRHELARRAWEESLEPAHANALHGQVLEVLLERGAAQVGVARLVHHADRAGARERVLHFAPAAAREAAALGAHREAAAHYATALRYADRLPAAERAALLEAYSYERHLTADIEEAVHAREAALALRRSLDDRVREGNDVRWLSRLAWFQGRRARALELGREAVRVLEPLGSTAELAMAYSNLAQLAMLADELDDAVVWGERAIALAEQLGDVDTLAHATNNVGSARLYAGHEGGLAQVERALALALENGFHEHAVRTYTILACDAVLSRNYAAAGARIAETLAFAAEHDIETFTLYILGWRARLHLERGEWEAAEQDANAVLSRYHVLDVVRFSALTVLGLLRARRGEPGAQALLDEALAIATPTRELQRIVPVAAARAEAAWIGGVLATAEADTRAGWELAVHRSIPWYRGPVAYWLWRAGGLDAAPESIAEPYRLQIEGDWRGAAAVWERIGCPYERALALAELDDADAQREALDVLERLGARAAAEAVRRDLRARGVRGIPRGPRPATRDNPGGLTRSQFKVLELLGQGLSNADIARQLFLSPRTVDHHVSALLQRLDARTRGEAVAAARSRGILV
jgi:DNA-binding CsgD family transcriptional regulator/tetratricopeptide (TPR) repeat protein